MERLTTNKSVADMSMIELAHNSCYADDERNARYRDYEMEMDARDFARNLMVTLAKDELPVDDAEFDEEILDNLTIDPFLDVRGLIALFYRNMLAMADLREKLKDYEDAEEQGLLPKLPCKVGDTVYVDSAILPISENIDHKIPSYFPARIVSFRFAKRNWMKIAVKAKWLHKWIDNETGPESAYIDSEKKFTISLSGIGKTVFLTESEAEAKLKEMEEKDGR
jgi:hypothetical protein|nr:MAG TPA: hypothetical protein [Caudoviricetes sp.]